MAKCLFIFSSFPARSMAQCLYCLSGLYSPLVVLETVGKMATDYARRIAMPRGTRRIDMLLQYLEVPGTLTCQSLTVARGAAHCSARRIDMPVAGSRKRGSALSHGLESCDSTPRVTPALLCPMVRHVSLHTFSTPSSLKCPSAHTVTHERRFTRAPCANTSACGAFEAL